MNNQEKYIGEIFNDRYKVIKRIGEGGMACVYEGFDSIENRMVAIKILKDEISNDSGSVKRFINESKAVQLMSHPNIVRIYDVSMKDELKYIAMEYVDGITLKSYIKQKGALSLAETISYTEQILRGLDHAHSKGVIHRDIKPQNILLLKDGHIKVTDFGIAKLPNAETVSMNDKAIGTVYYISPEQASGKPIDNRSDIYSLGAMMYEMLTGELIFNADTPVQVAMMQVTEQPKLPSEVNPDVPKGLEQIVMRALEKDPEDRFQSAKQMLSYVIQIKNNPNTIFKQPTKPQKKEESKVIKEKKQTPKQNKQPKSTGPKKKMKFTMFPCVLGVLLAFLAVFGLSTLFIASKVSSSFIPSKAGQVDIVVPSLVGEVFTEEMRTSLTNQGFKVSVEYDDNITEGEPNVILATTPEAGTARSAVSGKSSVDLRLSLARGANSIVLPDFTVHEQRSAEQQIQGLGLVCAEEYEYSDTVPSGLVIRTAPIAGSMVSSGGKVTIYISKGPQVTSAAVPQLIGRTENDAKETITSEGFEVGEITYEASSTVESGIVISQTPKAQDKASVGTKIDFVVSLGS